MHQISECFYLIINHINLANNYITHVINLTTESVLIKQKFHKFIQSQLEIKQFAFLQQLLHNQAKLLILKYFLHYISAQFTDMVHKMQLSCNWFLTRSFFIK